MAITHFSNPAEYAAAAKPTIESRVAMIESNKAVKYDGVNVITTEPVVGDAVFFDENNEVVIIAKDSLVKANIPAAWTYKGPVIARIGDWVMVMYGNVNSLPSKKYADVVQFSISAISATTIKFYLHMAGDYAAWVPVEVELTSAEINATSATEINSALELAGNTGNVGYDKHKYWAYLADAQGNKVDSDGTQIIVQCDTWADYRQYQCSDSTHALVGCTMTHVTWGDMPASDSYFKVNGIKTSGYGIMNIAGGALYWATNGRTLSANATVGGESGSSGPMKKSEYESSPYAAEIRAYYPTYEDYIRGEYAIECPQKLGAFALPDGATMTAKYGPMTAPVKTGGTKAKFPALNWAYELGAGAHLWDVTEGTLLMRDENLTAINATQATMGKVQISAATYRWWAERYGVYGAWLFNGLTRGLNANGVCNAMQVGAVTLFKIKL